MIELPIETFLESFPDGAVLISPITKRVIHANTRLTTLPRPTGKRPCYEELAGRTETCPFCPLDQLIADRAGPIEDCAQFRRGRTCMITVRFLPDINGSGLILETVRELAKDQLQYQNFDESERIVLPDMKMLTGLVLIGRDLMGGKPLDEKMEKLLTHLAAVLGNGMGVEAWVELDGRRYGESLPEVSPTILTTEIRVEDRVRGCLYACVPGLSALPDEGEYFLEEVADLIGRQLEIQDLETMLRQSEERYRKLATNLQKEMWSRTDALAKETGYLEGILRSSEDMIITTDLNTCIVEFNLGAEKILGYSSEEVQGRKIADLWVDAAERDRIMEDVTLSGGIRNYETKLLAKSGEIVEISLTLSLLKDAEGRTLGTVGISKDVARERKVRSKLERLNENYRETIHFISHETKNSLIVIGGFVRRLLDAETDPQRLRQLQIVYHHSKFLEAMSRDFLVMSELEHGEFQIRKEPIHDFYEEVILPAMMGLRERYPDSFQSYDASMGGVGAVELTGDRGLLEIVYRNLFGNALKYRHPEGKIAYGVVDQSGFYLFNVWNEGPGVAPDQVEKIFAKFYRVPDETTRSKRGTGLGLYNIRKIIEGHGGKIWCETKPGEWIDFRFVLPKG